jgi:hypothetical protein
VPVFDAASAEAVYAALTADAASDSDVASAAVDAVSDSAVGKASVGSGPAVLSNYLAVYLAGPRVSTSYTNIFLKINTALTFKHINKEKIIAICHRGSLSA